MKPILVLITLCSLSTLAMATAVFAAAPANDTYAGRIDIGGVPFSATMDTTEATTDADDAELNTFCGAPHTDASVWFEYTAPADGMVAVDLSGSSYPAGVLVGVGPEGNQIWACRPTRVEFWAYAGVTYAILAIDDQSDGGGNGGTLAISVEEVVLPPRPTLSLSVDATAQFHADGTVTLSGTMTCTGDVEYGYLAADLSQRLGRLVIIGSGAYEFACDGTTREWSMSVWAFNGLFRGGRAFTELFAQACGPGGCAFARLEQNVQLNGRPWR